MTRLSAKRARANLHRILHEVSRGDDPILIEGKRTNAVLVSEDAWRGIEETLYLVSIPGMRQSILEGGETPIAECAYDPW